MYKAYRHRCPKSTEKMLNIINYQRNTNKNYNWTIVSNHIGQNGHH